MVFFTSDSEMAIWYWSWFILSLGYSYCHGMYCLLFVERVKTKSKLFFSIAMLTMLSYNVFLTGKQNINVNWPVIGEPLFFCHVLVYIGYIF
jgi:hypothetical protein